MAVPTKRPGKVVSPGGTLMVMDGELSPHKDLAVSAKPGGGVCFCVMVLPGGVFTHWLGTVSVSVLWWGNSWDVCH